MSILFGDIYIFSQIYMFLFPHFIHNKKWREKFWLSFLSFFFFYSMFVFLPSFIYFLIKKTRFNKDKYNQGDTSLKNRLSSPGFWCGEGKTSREGPKYRFNSFTFLFAIKWRRAYFSPIFPSFPFLYVVIKQS